MTRCSSKHLPVATGYHSAARGCGRSGFPAAPYYHNYAPHPAGLTQDINSVPSLVTPAVVREVQRHFNCSSAAGAALETEGGDGTSYSHRERRHYDGELMIGKAAVAQRGSFSNITLAVLEDSGWFIPDYS